MKILQDSHPKVVDAIKKRLLHLQKDGAPLNVILIHGIILLTITVIKPSILDVPYHNGSIFKASDNFFVGGYNDILTGQKERQHELHKKHQMTGRLNVKNHSSEKHIASKNTTYHPHSMSILTRCRWCLHPVTR